MRIGPPSSPPRSWLAADIVFSIGLRAVYGFGAYQPGRCTTRVPRGWFFSFTFREWNVSGAPTFSGWNDST